MAERSAISDVIGVPDPHATAEPGSSAINDLSPDSHGPARMQLAGQAPPQSDGTGSDGQTISDRAAWRKAAHDIDQLKRPISWAGLQMTFNTLNTFFGIDGDGDFECASIIADTLHSSWAEYANKVADRCIRLAGSMHNAGTMQHNNDEERHSEFDRLSRRYRDTPGR
ncbi:MULTISPECIES: hypothetical protein [unclassified Streptomyces]|uniref:hypothetical protein n=1 Tax=unclassified Streptomyces TaxID=2593676 RepID=UPI002DD7E165|nr:MULTISPECIES: hypothetical protein [unclassified Streptomyces]WSA93763.1 hypothetical protein OIE63_20890 [Streptomyces sp. NBC_01795]WSB78133.1 hypothetical protein OHB04_21725 [Streptomyces sp. NBC_01775]WSS13615.1 hypothetical protein OG533_18255 [Streptomyces sp. NBC_01186]WSS42410.1 hypothetical protein OG220_18865 [Streptomyces sp. NBC_01187]